MGQLCRAYSAEGLLDAVSLRIGWVYGPGRTTGCDIRDVLLGKPSKLHPDHLRDYVFVEDVARAIVKSVLRPMSFGGMAINVSGGRMISHGEMELAAEHLTGRVVEKHRPPAGTYSEPLIPPLDISKSKLELDWEPQVSLSSGLQMYAKDLGVALEAVA